MRRMTDTERVALCALLRLAEQVRNGDAPMSPGEAVRDARAYLQTYAGGRHDPRTGGLQGLAVAALKAKLWRNWADGYDRCARGIGFDSDLTDGQLLGYFCARRAGLLLNEPIVLTERELRAAFDSWCSS